MFVLMLLAQIIDTTVRCSYYGYSYRVNNWYGGSTTRYYIYQPDPGPYSYPIMVGYDEDWLDEWARGYLQFPIDFIPQGATIINAGLRLYVAYVGQWSDEWDWHAANLWIFSMENNLADWYPGSGSQSSTLFNDAYDGYLFVDSPFYVEMHPQFNVYYPSDTSFLPMNSTFIGFLQDRINNGIPWVGLGIVKYDEEGYDGGVNFFGEESYLYVSYLMPNQPVFYDYTFYPDSGDIGTYFTFMVHFYDNHQYVPEYIQLYLKRPDNVIDVYNLYLVSGYPYDGIYAARFPITFPGTYGVSFFARTGGGLNIVYPQQGFLPGPKVIVDSTYLYYEYVENDTSNVGTPVVFGIKYKTTFYPCDSLFVNLIRIEPYDTTNVNQFRFPMTLVWGTPYNGTYEVSVNLPAGRYVRYYEGFGGTKTVRFPESGESLDGPCVLWSSVGENLHAGIIKYKVFDALGRFVGHVENEKNLKSLSLTKGVYYLIPITRSGAVKPKKVVKIN